MKIYLVGGAVRDELLNRPVHDRDYVVVGATHEEMIEKGFSQVGAAFPVYLHPETNEEYALARTERRVGDGHKGFETFFSPDVTLEEDLSRRDLTINAMARDLETGFIIDPFNGMSDLCNNIIRHTSPAFMDDPLRILRAIRLQSQLGDDWSIDQETYSLMFKNKERLKEISPERKWKEMEKALNSNLFSQYAWHLGNFGELPELENLRGVLQPADHHPEGDAYKHTMLCLEQADCSRLSPEAKFAVLCHDFGKATTYRKYGNLLGHEQEGVPLVEQLCERIRIPNDFRDIAKFVAENHTRVHTILPRGSNKGIKPRSLMKLLESAGNISSGKTYEKIIALADACYCDATGRGPNHVDKPYPQGDLLIDSFYAASRVESKSISTKMLEEGKTGLQIGEAIRVARIDAIREVLKGRVFYLEKL